MGHTISHNIITELNFIMFEFILVIPVLRLLNRIVSGFDQLGNQGSSGLLNP